MDFTAVDDGCINAGGGALGPDMRLARLPVLRFWSCAARWQRPRAERNPWSGFTAMESATQHVALSPPDVLHTPQRVRLRFAAVSGAVLTSGESCLADARYTFCSYGLAPVLIWAPHCAA